MELALSFGTSTETTASEAKVHAVTVNPPARDESFTKLQQTLESVSERLEQLES